jgi:hypothetical protein
VTDTFFEGETEQHLTCLEMATRTLTVTDDPPEFMLMMDVEHNESKMQWRQEVALSKPKAIELTKLMAYSLDNVGVEWRDNG